MGSDLAFEGTWKIRKALNLISIIEEAKQKIGTGEILEILAEREIRSVEENKVISDFLDNHIVPWEEEQNVRIVDGDNLHDEKPKSPFTFNLDIERSQDRKVYLELLRIAFALIVIKQGELGFLENLLSNERPLSSLMAIVNSISNSNYSHLIKITYRLRREIRTDTVRCHKISQEGARSEWYLSVQNDEGIESKILLKRLISAELA